MSKSIAKAISDTHKDIRLKLPTTKLKIGEVIYTSYKDRDLFHLITKSQFFHKPLYDNIRNTLHNLQLTLATKLRAQNIAMLTIASGLDNCD